MRVLVKEGPYILANSDMTMKSRLDEGTQADQLPALATV